MDKVKVAQELVAVAKLLSGGLSLEQVDREFGKTAINLVELEKLTRNLKIDRAVQKSMHDKVQDAIEAIDAAMDEWSEYFN